jgi:hypothetical protein
MCHCGQGCAATVAKANAAKATVASASAGTGDAGSRASLAITALADTVGAHAAETADTVAGAEAGLASVEATVAAFARPEVSRRTYEQIMAQNARGVEELVRLPRYPCHCCLLPPHPRSHLPQALRA